MRAVLQRVRSASVTVDDRVVGAIEHGLLVFVGVAPDDGPEDLRYITTKIRELRIFADDAGRMNRSVVESNGSVLVVSQFTLYADARKGRRPSFINAARPETAEPLVNAFADALRGVGLPVEQGVFGAEMAVALVNDGPVTIVLDSAAILEEFRKLAATDGTVAAKAGDLPAKGTKTIEAEYYVPYLAHAPMEPLNATARITDDKCEVWAGTQFQTMDQQLAAKAAGMEPSQVELHTTFLGGGFGRRANPTSDFVTDAVHVALWWACRTHARSFSSRAC